MTQGLPNSGSRSRLRCGDGQRGFSKAPSSFLVAVSAIIQQQSHWLVDLGAVSDNGILKNGFHNSQGLVNKVGGRIPCFPGRSPAFT